MLGLPFGMAQAGEEGLETGQQNCPPAAWTGDRGLSAQKVHLLGDPFPQLRIIRFGSVEQAELLLRGAGLPIELLQLVGGDLKGDLLGLRLGPLQLLRIRLSLPVHAAGPKPPGHQVITLPLDQSGAGSPLRAHGQPLPQACLFGLDACGEIHLTTSATCHLALVMLDQDRFLEWAEALGGPELEARNLVRNWVPLDRARHEGLRVHLLRLFGAIEKRPQNLTLPGWECLACEDLMPLLLEALAHGAQLQPALRRPPARIELVKAAERWMVEHPHEPISLEALCREVYAGRRSLIQGFRDHLGMGPMAFLKLHRLHGVRRLLLAADPQVTRIQPLAMEWGFLNPGHFARDYRRLFGERPSDTLGRSASPLIGLGESGAGPRSAPPPPQDSPAAGRGGGYGPGPTVAPPPVPTG
jgi:AraC family ethanolamine operon transcriptional activator